MSHPFGALAGVRRAGCRSIARSAANVVEHRLHRNFGLAEDAIRRVVRRWGDGGAFVLTCQLAATALPSAFARGDFIHTHVAYVDEDDNVRTDVTIDDAPPLVRAAVRLVSCVAAGDGPTAWAVWRTMPIDDRRTMIITMTELAAHGWRIRKEKTL